MQIKKITNFLLDKYPLSDKEIWDPSGFSIKFNLSEKLTGIILAIDLTTEVVEEAIAKKCNLIITHHPFLFEKTKELEEIKAPYKTKIITLLKKYRISAISFHTNYDKNPLGTSYQIAKYMNFENYITYDPNKYSCAVTVNTTAKQIIENLKNNIKINSFRTNLDKEYLDKNIKKIAILSGSGYIGDINEFTKKGFDLIISSDFKWSDWINFQQINAPILEVPHLDEQVFVWDVFDILKAKFTNLNIYVFNISVPYRNL